MSAPPIVGVPDLMRCVDGPSSRTAWPILKAVSLRIIAGPTMKEIASAVSAASTTRSVMYEKTLNMRKARFSESHCASSSSIRRFLRGERVGDALHLHEARALHQHHRARARARLERLDERLAIVEVASAGAEGLDGTRALGAEREEVVDLEARREAPDLGVQLRRLLAQLAHVAHDEMRCPASSVSTASAAFIDSGLALYVSSISTAPFRPARRCNRPGTPLKRVRPSCIACGGISSACATAQAAAALARLCSPATCSVATNASAGVTNRACAPSALTCTSASGPRPKVTTRRPALRSFQYSANGSSAFTIATPPGPRPE